MSSLMQNQTNRAPTRINQESKGQNSPNSVGNQVDAEQIDQKSTGDQSPNSIGARNVDVSVQK